MKLRYDELLSNLAYKCNLCRCNQVEEQAAADKEKKAATAMKWAELDAKSAAINPRWLEAATVPPSALEVALDRRHGRAVQVDPRLTPGLPCLV